MHGLLVAMACLALSACTEIKMSGPMLQPAESQIYDIGYRDLLETVYRVLSQSPDVTEIEAVEVPMLGYAFDLAHIDVTIVFRPVTAMDPWERTIVGYARDITVNGEAFTLTPAAWAVQKLISVRLLIDKLDDALAPFEAVAINIQYADL